MKKRFLLLYHFHKVSHLILHRLIRLKKLNPDSMIVPCFGIKQKVSFPLIINLNRAPLLFYNWFFLKNSSLYDFSKKVNEKVESYRRKNEINALKLWLYKNGFNLHCDFTPLGYFNLDLSVLNWFSSKGKYIDFDYLIFYEHDVFTSKSIKELYEKYTTYDAGFVHYQKPPSAWYWNTLPPGGKKSIINWLEKKTQKTITLYRCIFALNFVSYKVLSELERMRLPYGHCELRWPSIISNLGFSCTNLDFPMVQYKIPVSQSEIELNWGKGVFHPVYENINEY